MSPRKPTVDGLDDVDDEDGVLEEEAAAQPADFDLRVQDEAETGLGGLSGDPDETEEA